MGAGSMSTGEVRFKLTLQYDGTAFHGWQVQPGSPTIQGEVERAVARLAGERRPVVGSGRTDAGVHATGQVAAVSMPARWEGPALARSLNALLPHSIWVRSAVAVPEGFHPRRDAVLRHYRYRVGTEPEAASPFHRPWCWPLLRPLDMKAAARAAQSIVGEHDFRAFARAGQPQRGYRCRVTRARWNRRDGPGVVFEISANRFLHRMVRYLVGTMVEIALGRRDESEMLRLLQRRSLPRDGKRLPITSSPAPPGGLFLVRVDYPGAEMAMTAGDRPGGAPR